MGLELVGLAINVPTTRFLLFGVSSLLEYTASTLHTPSSHAGKGRQVIIVCDSHVLGLGLWCDRAELLLAERPFHHLLLYKSDGLALLRRRGGGGGIIGQSGTLPFLGYGLYPPRNLAPSIQMASMNTGIAKIANHAAMSTIDVAIIISFLLCFVFPAS